MQFKIYRNYNDIADAVSPLIAGQDDFAVFVGDEKGGSRNGPVKQFVMNLAEEGKRGDEEILFLAGCPDEVQSPCGKNPGNLLSLSVISAGIPESFSGNTLTYVRDILIPAEPAASTGEFQYDIFRETVVYLQKFHKENKTGRLVIDIPNKGIMENREWKNETAGSRLIVEDPPGNINDSPNTARLSFAQKESILSEMGFIKETNRIYKKTGRHEFSEKSLRSFDVRPAREDDRFFMYNLAAANAESQLIPGLEEYSEQILREYSNTYFSLPIENSGEVFIYIVEDKKYLWPVGFIVFQVTGGMASAEKYIYLYDLNIHKDYMGKHAVQRVVLEGENHMAGMGYEYIYGDTSASNRRAYIVAKRTLDFRDHGSRFGVV